jgi:hypothetical protein
MILYLLITRNPSTAGYRLPRKYHNTYGLQARSLEIATFAKPGDLRAEYGLFDVELFDGTDRYETSESEKKRGGGGGGGRGGGGKVFVGIVMRRKAIKHW